MITRRFFAGGACLAAGLLMSTKARAAAGAEAAPLADSFSAIEKASGGRLGIAGLDTGTGTRFAHRADERFPLCSTFKLIAVGALLAQVDQGKERLQRRIRFTASEVLDGSPITRHRTGGDGMTLGELCAAALDDSDNTAANLILATIGGPAAVTRFARSLGDQVTRLDRTEPILNEATPGDPRDTTTPAAMVVDMQKLLLGDALSRVSRDGLKNWLIANKTGDTRLRAGFPRDWRVGDKTGTGDHGTANDVAIAWPPSRAPILLAVYLTESTVPTAQRDQAIAAVGRAVARAYPP